MRSYIIDEISRSDMEQLRGHLEERTERSSLEDLYWLNLPPELLEGVQVEHEGCQPYCVAIEVGDHFVRFELLVRSRVNHRCGCASYAEPAQREFVIAFAEEMVRELKIQT
jgi:hypothetical protein